MSEKTWWNFKTTVMSTTWKKNSHPWIPSTLDFSTRGYVQVYEGGNFRNSQRALRMSWHFYGFSWKMKITYFAGWNHQKLLRHLRQLRPTQRPCNLAETSLLGCFDKAQSTRLRGVCVNKVERFSSWWFCTSSKVSWWRTTRDWVLRTVEPYQRPTARYTVSHITGLVTSQCTVRVTRTSQANPSGDGVTSIKSGRRQQANKAICLTIYGG